MQLDLAKKMEDEEFQNLSRKQVEYLVALHDELENDDTLYYLAVAKLLFKPRSELACEEIISYVLCSLISFSRSLIFCLFHKQETILPLLLSPSTIFGTKVSIG